jgi:quinol monooxygenase YgiN
MDEGIKIFRDAVMPQQKQQPGYKGALLLVDRATGKAMVFSLWQTEAEMKASEQNDHYRKQIAKFAHLFTAPSTQEVFGVSFHDLG